ncbi:MAG: trimeric intracellular cation channel family protein [Geminicoccaceae bacterium]
MHLLYWLDLTGVAVFAISGALEAARKQLDPVGFLFVAAVTGIGGGTLRDVLLDRPVFWLHDPVYLWTTSAMALLTFFVAPHLQRRAAVLLWADAMGMAVFCVLGARTALAAGTGPTVAVLMGTMTATFGGLIRDVVCTETPLLLRREIYATAAAVGAAALVAARAAGLSDAGATTLGVTLALAIRGVALARGLSLPAYRPRPGRPR